MATGAEVVATLLRDAGLDDVQVLAGLTPDGAPGAPAVVGRRPAPPGRPTVLLYAHQDVQPPGDETLWTSAPFEPSERDGRLFGRGTGDDKGGVVAHLVALRALLPTWGPDDGVGLVVLVEGEEEIGSPTFARLLAQHVDLLAADVVVVADATSWSRETPSLTVSLRGLATVDLHVGDGHRRRRACRGEVVERAASVDDRAHHGAARTRTGPARGRRGVACPPAAD